MACTEKVCGLLTPLGQYNRVFFGFTGALSLRVVPPLFPTAFPLLMAFLHGFTAIGCPMSLVHYYTFRPSMYMYVSSQLTIPTAALLVIRNHDALSNGRKLLPKGRENDIELGPQD